MLTEERARWLYCHYRWLETALPPRGAAIPLVLPSAPFFRFSASRDHAFAVEVFEAVRAIMGLENWPCRLEAESDEDAEFRQAMARAGVLGVPGQRGAAGTFSAGEEVVITYSKSMLRTPVRLIATLAHEWCHYLLATVQSVPPAGWEELEPLTDLAAVHEGFGVILTNSAFSFGQWSDSQSLGWQCDTLGYLNDSELAFALAIFCHRNAVNPDVAQSHLKPNPREIFLDALPYVAELEQTWETDADGQPDGATA